MKLKILFSIWLIGTGVLCAQVKLTDKVVFKEQKSAFEKSGREKPSIIGKIKENIITVNYNRGEVVLKRYDASLKKVGEGEYTTVYDGKSFKRTWFKIIGDRLFLFGERKVKEEAKTYLYAKEVNTKTLVDNKPFKELLQIDNHKSSGLISIQYVNYNIVGNESKTSMAIVVNEADESIEEKYDIYVYDNNLKLLWEGAFNSKMNERYFVLKEIKLSEDNQIFFVGKLYQDRKESKKSRREGVANYSNYIVRINPQHIDKKKIEIEGKFLRDLKFGLGKNGEIICAGLYSEKNSWSVKGAFYLSLDKNFKVVKQSMQAFDFDLIVENLSDKQLKKVKKKKEKGKDIELYEYDLQDILVREDGSALLVAEQYYVVVTRSTDRDLNGRELETTTYHYYYNDLLVVNITPQGVIDWARKIPKRQYSTNDGGYYSSYQMLEKNGNVYFVFNGSLRNYEMPDLKGRLFAYTPRSKKYALELVTLKPNGSFEKEIIKVESRKIGRYFIKGAKEGDKGELIIPKWVKRGFYFCNLKVK